MHQTVKTIVSLLLAGSLLGGCGLTKDKDEPTVGMANPASENCVKVGGTLVMQKDGSGGEYGVCVFEDNRQCEEWALMRGECPVGGHKITGYNTAAAQLCVITGGEYKETGNNKQDEEQGTCTKGGKTCDVYDYYNRKCDL